MQKIFEGLLKIKDIDLKKDHDLTKLTTIKVKSTGHLIVVKTVAALVQTVELLNIFNADYRMVGLGANQVLKSSNHLFYIKLKLNGLDPLNELKDKYVVDASLSLNKLSSLAKKFNLDGWQCITGIPATVGGAICMNAGTRIGEIKDILVDVTVLRKNSKLECIKITNEHFSYRKNHFLNEGDIIVQATLKHNGVKEGVKEEINDYLNKRKLDQPWGTNNCGCVFKNSDALSAGMAIDLLKLKGTEYKGMKVSLVHGNFIENTNADYDSFIEFVEFIQYQLKVFCGQKFELEVKID